jgi:hypothetical protein
LFVIVLSVMWVTVLVTPLISSKTRMTGNTITNKKCLKISKG